MLALLGVCLLAATAPIAPAVLQTIGVWVAPIIIALRLRAVAPLDALAVAVALWASTAAIGHTWYPEVRATAWAYWSVALIFVATRCTIRTAKDIAAVGAAYLCGCLYAAADVIGQARQLDTAIDAAPARIGAGGINANYTAYALVAGILIAVALLFVAPLPRLLRIGVGLTTVVFGYAILWTGTRGAQLAVALMLIYLLASTVNPRVVWIVSAVAAAVTLVAVPAGLYGDERLLWWQQFFDRQDDGLSGRFYVWEVARDLWYDNLWTGIGPGMFPISNALGIGAHSVPLTIAVELGVIGLVLVAATFVGALRSAAAGGPTTQRLAGMLVIAWLPVWLSGHWELSPVAWLAVAMWSRLPAWNGNRGQHRLRRNAAAVRPLGSLNSQGRPWRGVAGRGEPGGQRSRDATLDRRAVAEQRRGGGW
ncbi:O-antigen ligase family protein [Micromonospora sp. NPDC047620]|uniref:O-antigen ligase family protein n=1 Tax=Micromonospora sp. NPDC047620 TaxID=3364251 RepID=UPI0037208447